jgi:biopolymer transport protein ExbB
MPGLVPGLFLIEESMENTTAVVENPYGPLALWQQGDFVARGTLIILAVMSLFSWYIILTKIWDQRKLRGSAKVVDKNFWNAPSVKDGVERLKKGDDYRNIAEDGLRAASHHDGRLTDRIDLHEWITMSLQRSVEVVNGKLQTGLAFLATVGSTAPFIGLFGTVWGIYHALIAIGLAGQASIDKVAGPVGEALIMTAFGLFVAVPAVLGYNWLIRRNKTVQDGLRNFAADLHAYLISGARVGANDASATTGGARPVAAPAAAVRK